MIPPEFYQDIAQNAMFYHINYTYLSYFDRVFISFWIVISIWIGAKFIKMELRKKKRKYYKHKGRL